MTHTFKEHCLIHNKKLLDEWADARDPNDFETHDKRKVKWICIDCGYEWMEPIYSRNHQYFPTKCPKCTGTIDYEGNIVNDNFGVRCSTLINKEWSYKNRIDPKKLPISSTKLCWWKCPICGGHYKKKLNKKIEGLYKTCDVCKGKYFSNTSFAEQSVHYYLKQIYPKTLHNYMGVDIYIPEINTVVLYISPYDHMKKREKYLVSKKEKVALFCVERNPNVIKILEKRVPDAEGNIIKRQDETENDLTETIIALIKLLSEKPIEVNVVKDKYKILEHMKKEFETSEMYNST